MRPTSLVAAILAAIALAAGPARADTLNPVYEQGARGGATANAGPPPAPTIRPVGPSLSEELRSRLQGATPGADRMEAIRQRVEKGVKRMSEALAGARQTGNAQARAQLRQAYEEGLASLRRGVGETEALTTDPARRAAWEQWEQNTERTFTEQLVLAGLYSEPAPYVEAPKRPSRLAEELRRSLASDGPPQAAAQRVSVACRDQGGVEVPGCSYTFDGGACTRRTLGPEGPDLIEITTDLCPPQVKEAYCRTVAQAPFCPRPQAVATPGPLPAAPVEAAARPAAQLPIVIGEDEIHALTWTPDENLVSQLPPGCRQAFGNYLQDVHAAQASKGDTERAVGSYGDIDAQPECRAAMKRLADANSLPPPVRHLTPLTRSAFDTAFAQDPSHPQMGIRSSEAGSSPLGDPEGVELRDSGYDAGEVLEFGIALLGLAGNAASLAGALRGGASAGAAVGGALGGSLPLPTGGRRETPYVSPQGASRSTITGRIQ